MGATGRSIGKPAFCVNRNSGFCGLTSRSAPPIVSAQDFLKIEDLARVCFNRLNDV